MKLKIFVTFGVASMCCLIIAFTTGVLTYVTTREKWHELGKMTGEANGKISLMRELCKISPAPPQVPHEPDYVLHVKDASLYVKKTKTGLTIACK